MTSDREHDNTMVLRDGRTLGWATYGNPDGAPVVALHGSPDSRKIWALVDDGARRHGLRLLCPDRPGFGISDPRPGRAVLDWPDDLTCLVDHLGIDRFPVLAISGGGAYACACAWKMPERVSGLGLFSVIGPLDVPGATEGMNRPVRITYTLAGRAPWLLGLWVRALAPSARRNPEKALTRLARTRPPEDRDVIERPEVRAALLDNLPNQIRDPATVEHEFRLAVQPWPIPLGEITQPTHIWQGGRDDVHTPAMARHLAASIPGAELTLRPDFATFNFLDDLDPMLETISTWCT